MKTEKRSNMWAWIAKDHFRIVFEIKRGKWILVADYITLADAHRAYEKLQYTSGYALVYDSTL